MSANIAFWLAVVVYTFMYLVGVWDIYAKAYLPADATVTYYVRLWARQEPVLSFLAGMVAGHLFFSAL